MIKLGRFCIATVRWAVWKDVTSYSHGGDRTPRSWAIDLGGLQMSITTGHIYHPGKWVVHCEPWFNAHEIADSAIAAPDAQRLGLQAVWVKLEKAHTALRLELAK
jgi:hypothetical protein